MTKKLSKQQRELIEQRLKELKHNKVMPYCMIISGIIFVFSIIGALLGILLIIVGGVWLDRIKKEIFKYKLEYGYKILN